MSGGCTSSSYTLPTARAAWFGLFWPLWPIHAGRLGPEPRGGGAFQSRRRIPAPMLCCVLLGLLPLALRRGGLAPQGRNRPQVMQCMTGHDLPPAMPMELPAKGAVADPSTFHSRDDAA